MPRCGGGSDQRSVFAGVEKARAIEKPSQHRGLACGSIAQAAAGKLQAIFERTKEKGFSLDNDKDRTGKAESLFSAAEDFQALWDKERKKLLEELLGRENAALFLLYCVERIPAGELTQRFGVTEDCLRMRVSRMKKKILEHPEIFSAVTLLLVRFLTCFDIKG
jgi:hypothetical protein